jgi:pyruvate formate lyase activating enzyme
MEASEAAAEAGRDRLFHEESGGGVTVSGGEPLAQPAFTLALLEALMKAGIHTALDTCGAAGWDVFRRALPLVGLFLYDLKAVDPLLHRRYTGSGNEGILANLKALVGEGAAVVVRIPIVPGVNDGPDEVGAMARFAAGLKGLKGVDLLAYHRAGIEKYRRLGLEYALPGVTPPPRERMDDIARVFREAGLKVGEIGG